MSGSTPPPEPPLAPVAEPAAEIPFAFDEDRRFQLYMEQRRAYAQGARTAYQWFDQTIIALSAGAIALSISFVKDIGLASSTIPWLFGCWGAFLMSAACAFISLLTSASADIDRMAQIDCLVTTGDCDESKAVKLGVITQWLNRGALIFTVLGIVCIMVFATRNVIQKGEPECPPKNQVRPAAQRSPASPRVPPSSAKVPLDSISPEPSPAKP